MSSPSTDFASFGTRCHTQSMSINPGPRSARVNSSPSGSSQIFWPASTRRPPKIGAKRTPGMPRSGVTEHLAAGSRRSCTMRMSTDARRLDRPGPDRESGDRVEMDSPSKARGAGIEPASEVLRKRDGARLPLLGPPRRDASSPRCTGVCSIVRLEPPDSPAVRAGASPPLARAPALAPRGFVVLAPSSSGCER